MALALKARHKARRKGGSKERVFGCDLQEHLQHSGQDVPQVLRSCTEFVEQHGVVDGIYRLSGVSSNIQRLRQEFDAARCPDLRRAVYLQDIHCVSSLCKAYFRELPNPLLTYQLYDKFADAVAVQMEDARLVKIKEVLKELPAPHYRTLEFLMRHLLRMASFSSRTNMHARNLAIVWAPNLLRSKDIETTGFNGTAAFMEVRVQSIVVEFILTHVEQLFGDAPLHGAEPWRRSLGEQVVPAPRHVPAALSQGDGPPAIRPYHTIIELSDHRRKGSLKARKWRSIFNLGRSSHEAKRKPARAEEKDDSGGKVTLRPAKSMDSLSSCSGTDPPGLGPQRGAKQRPQRRESFDACSAPPECGSAPDWSPEEMLKGLEEAQETEREGESGTKSEPSTPKGVRAASGAPTRSPKGGHGRAEKCSGVHISGPFSVTVPFHITANLSRLTRGQPCLALPGGPELPTHGSTARPEEPQHRPEEEKVDAEATRLSLELRDSFAFLDSQEPWLEGAGDAEMAAWALLPLPGHGDREGCVAIEEGVESGFMSPGEPPTEQPGSYLSIEECIQEEIFFMAPSGSDAEDGDTDSDEMFLSAHDDLSPLAASLEPLNKLPGEGSARGSPTPAQPDTPSATATRDATPTLGLAEPCSKEEEEEKDALGEGEHPRTPSTHREWGEGEGGIDGAETGPGGETREDEGPVGAGEGPDVSDKEFEEDGAASRASTPDEPREGEAQLFLGFPPSSSQDESPQELAETLGQGSVPEVIPDSVQGSVPDFVPDFVPEVVPEVVLGSVPDSIPKVVAEVVPGSVPMSVPGSVPKAVPEVIPEAVPISVPKSVPGSVPNSVPEAVPEVVPEAVPISVPKSVPGSVPNSVPEVVLESTPEALPFSVPCTENPGATTVSSPASPSLSSSSVPDLLSAAPDPPGPLGADPCGEPGRSEPAAVLRRDGSAAVRLATRSVRVQQARSVPVVPPKPQFARVPLALEGDAAVPPWWSLSLPVQDGPPALPGGVGVRQAGWREGGGDSCDTVMAVEGSATAQLLQPLSPTMQEGPPTSSMGGDAEMLPWRPLGVPAPEGPPTPAMEGDVAMSSQQPLGPPALEGPPHMSKVGDAEMPSWQPHGPPAREGPPPPATVGNVEMQPLSPPAPGGPPPPARSIGASPEGGSVSFVAAVAMEGGAAVPPPQPLSPSEGPSPPSGSGGGGMRRTGWREGSSISFDTAVAMAAAQQLSQAPVRRLQTYGGEERAPAAPRVRPFHQAPLRLRRPRPLSCVAAPEGEVSGRGQLGGDRPAMQGER